MPICRACGYTLLESTSCFRCGYITYTEPEMSSVGDVGSHISFAPTGFWDDLDFPPDAPGQAERIILTLLEHGFNNLSRHCQEFPAETGGAFLSVLAGLNLQIQQLWNAGQTNSLNSIKHCVIQVSPALQALYFSIELAGGLVPEVCTDKYFSEPTEAAKYAQRISCRIGELAKLLRELRRGLIRIGFSRDRMVVEPNIRFVELLTEQRLNRERYERASAPRRLELDLLAPREASELMRKELGFGFDDIMTVLMSRLEPWRMISVELGALFQIRLEDLDDLHRLFASKLSLSLSTVQTITNPFWFGLANLRPKSKKPISRVIADACAENWINCFPLFHAKSVRGQPVVIVADQVFYTLLTLLENAKSRIVDRLVRRSDSSSVHRLQQRTHRALEREVETIALERGWAARRGIKKNGSVLLECGEIDLLCGSTGIRSKVILCEVKDFDLSVEREIDFAKQMQGIEKAIGQLVRKRDWVESHREVVSAWLSVAKEFQLESWVVGTRYVAPTLTGHFPLIPRGTFGKHLDRSRIAEESFWWKPFV
jgi:uncharacterized protein (UPF0218 family)